MNLGADWVPKVVTVALGAYSLLSWIILLAGLGAFQSLLDDSDIETTALTWHWWIVWFALPLLIAALAAAAMNHPPVLVRPLSLLFAVEFTKLTILIDDAYKLLETGDWLSKVESRLNAIMAGGVMLSMGALSFTAWLAALDASGLTQTRAADAAAPGHAAAGGQAGAYNPHATNQAAAAPYAYNLGTPGVGNQPPPNGVIHAPALGAHVAAEPGPVGAPGAAGVPPPDGISPGNPVLPAMPLVQPGAAAGGHKA